MAWGLIAAAVGSQLIGGASSIFGAKKGADATVKAAEIAAQQQRDAMSTALRLGRPQMEVGQSALGVLAQLFGLPAPSAIDFDEAISGAGGGPTNLGARFDPNSLTREQQRALEGFMEPFGWNPLTERGARIGASGRHAPESEWSDRQRSRRAEFAAAFGWDPFDTDTSKNPILSPQQKPASGTSPGGAAGGGVPASLEDLILNNPGINFVRDQGERAISRAAAARGLNQSGGTLEGLAEFNTGLAATNYQNMVLNPLFQLAGFGNQQTAAGQNIVTGTGTNLANIAMNAGTARSSAYQNAGNVVGNMAGDIGNLLLLKQFGAFG